MKDNFCYFNGEFLKFSEIRISPFDLGFVRGYGVFDAMRTANGIPFCFKEHWDKFKSSAELLDLDIPIDEKQMRLVLENLLKKNNFKEMAIKTIIAGGESENGFVRGDKATFLIIVDDLNNFNLSPDIYRKGVKIIARDYQRSFAGIKNLNYIFPLNIQKQKNQANALEIVYRNNNNISECSTSNIFMVKGGDIFTAKDNVFKGTVRNLVIKLAQENNLNIVEREIRQEEFVSADEVFLTATYKKIVPVVQIDEILINNGKVGKITRKLMQTLDDFIDNYKEEQIKI